MKPAAIGDFKRSVAGNGGSDLGICERHGGIKICYPQHYPQALRYCKSWIAGFRRLKFNDFNALNASNALNFEEMAGVTGVNQPSKISDLNWLTSEFGRTVS